MYSMCCIGSSAVRIVSACTVVVVQYRHCVFEAVFAMLRTYAVV
jgi:hypothetical protein